MQAPSSGERPYACDVPGCARPPRSRCTSARTAASGLTPVTSPGVSRLGSRSTAASEAYHRSPLRQAQLCSRH
ncbi:hypothetical protein T492DRAFT_1096251, partial [Pavlovales sp. CCMP2436]